MSDNRQVLSVSNLNRQVAMLLEQQVGTVWLEAEIGQFTAASSGHWYLTLKDSHAQVRCAMFKFKNRSVRQQPKQGDRVLVKASVSLYQPRGEYQLVLEMLMPAGSGRLQLELEQLKRKLDAQGLFSVERKQPLPQPIRRVGIITSATGAALQDILSVLARRDPGMQVVIYPCQVQGDSAAGQLVSAIETANRRNEVDLLLLSRGGGSLEDLWCFNSEALAHAIADSQLPLVSAVGHEVDVTIADLVADLRAATPSAAAELISQDSNQRQAALDQLQARLVNAKQLQLQQYLHQLEQLDHQLQRQDPAVKLATLQQQFDEREFRLRQALSNRLQTAGQKRQSLHTRLQLQHPQSRLNSGQQALTSLSQRLHQAQQQQLKQAEQRWQEQMHALDLVSPLAVLARGYSITSQAGRIIKQASQVEPGQRLTTRLAQGEISSEVISVAD